MRKLLCASALIVAPAIAQVDQQLLDQAATDLGTSTPTAVTATVDDAEQAARVQLAVAQARVLSIEARKALRSKQTDVAGQKAQQVIEVLAAVPDAYADEFRLQAEAILTRVGSVAPRVAGQQVQVQPGLSEQVTRRIASEYTGALKPEIPTEPSQWGYQPGANLVDKTRVFERDHQRLYYEGGLREAIRSDELRRLVEAEESRVAPSQDVTYPPDWQARVAKRAKYEGGEIARSDTRTGPNGEEWHVSVYDISDLTYVPPNFTNSPVLDLWTASTRAANLAAVRNRSFIFGGYPEDLAAGLPLLSYLGGTDMRAFSGPVYSAERQRQIVDMITAFTDQHQGAMIISQPGRP